MDHRQPADPDPGVERRSGARRSRPGRTVDSPRPRRAPCPGRTPTRSSGTPRAAMASAMSASSSTVVPIPNPPPAEFSSTSTAASGPPFVSAITRATPSAIRSVPAATPAPRCDPVWTLTNLAANPGALRRSFVRTPIDRSKKSSSGPARLTRYAAVNCDRADSVLAEPLPERGLLPGRIRPAPPGGRVVAEDLDRVRADLLCPVDGPDHSGAERQVGAESTAVGEHGRHRSRRCPARTARSRVRRLGATVPTMADELRRLTDQERVIRAFVRDGRLASIPAKPKKRELLLPYLLDLAFPEDRDYEEREVNQRLGSPPPRRRRSAPLPRRRRAHDARFGHLPPGRADGHRDASARSMAVGSATSAPAAGTKEGDEYGAAAGSVPRRAQCWPFDRRLAFEPSTG